MKKKIRTFNAWMLNGFSHFFTIHPISAIIYCKFFELLKQLKLHAYDTRWMFRCYAMYILFIDTDIIVLLYGCAYFVYVSILCLLWITFLWRHRVEGRGKEKKKIYRILFIIDGLAISIFHLWKWCVRWLWRRRTASPIKWQSINTTSINVMIKQNSQTMHI